MRLINLSGKQFGRLTVLFRDGESSSGPRWRCLCACGKQTVVQGKHLRCHQTKSCGCAKHPVGTESPFWKGGRKVLKNGYVQIRIPGIRNEFEHRFVMTNFLGRALFRGETVHHRNGDRQDNRIENLELRCKNHGPGQTIPELITWAKEILRRYENRA